MLDEEIGRNSMKIFIVEILFHSVSLQMIVTSYFLHLIIDLYWK